MVSSVGKGLVGMVDARDIGAVAAEIAAAPTSYVGKTYWLSGPALISNYDVAEVIAQAFSLTAAGDAEWISEDVEAILSRPARSYQPFATDYASAFSEIRRSPIPRTRSS